MYKPSIPAFWGSMCVLCLLVLVPVLGRPFAIRLGIGNRHELRFSLRRLRQRITNSFCVSFSFISFGKYLYPEGRPVLFRSSCSPLPPSAHTSTKRSQRNSLRVTKASHDQRRAVTATRHSSSSTSSTLTLFNSHQLSPIMPKKLRCNAKECREPAQRIVGDCTFCNGHFCGKHRLLEDHKCSGLEDCKKQSHARNAAQLEAERTQVIRGV
ncbi:hypothetical protein V8C44DRAFT_35865 [Trichoderma aethiopicum]